MRESEGLQLVGQSWAYSDTGILTSSTLVRAVAEPGFHEEDIGQLWQVAIPWLQ